MCNPRKYFPEWDKKVRYFYNDLERAVLLGSVMWWAGTAERDREYDEMIAYGKTVLKFREAIQPMVKGGTFVDEKYLLSKGKGQNVTFFESEKGLLTLVGNVDETDFNLQIKLPFAPKSIRMGDVTNEKAPSVKILDDKTEITGGSKLQFVYFEK